MVYLAIKWWFSIAMLNNQMVCIIEYGICLSIYDRHDRHVSRQKYASTHSCFFCIYREREREFQPLRTMGLWAAILWYGECSLMLTYRLPVPGVPGEKGGNNVDQWHTQSGLAIDFCEGNIFQRWMAWWAVDANMLRQFCASKKKKKKN